MSDMLIIEGVLKDLDDNPITGDAFLAACERITDVLLAGGSGNPGTFGTITTGEIRVTL